MHLKQIYGQMIAQNVDHSALIFFGLLTLTVAATVAAATIVGTRRAAALDHRINAILNDDYEVPPSEYIDPVPDFIEAGVPKTMGDEGGPHTLH